MPIDPVTIAAIIGAGTGLVDRFISKGDIAAQNAYNSPKEQLARLREAGLPMAAMTGQTSGNQSVIPEQGNFKASIGESMKTSMTLAQMKILKEEARLKGSEADLNEARRNYLLSGMGEDVAGTNLTGILKGERQLQQNQIEGGRFANMLAGVTARNAALRTSLENQNLVVDIQKKLADMGLVNEHTKGAKLDNDIKNIVRQYQPEMSRLQVERLVKENLKLDYDTEGSRLSNVAKEIENIVANATKDARIHMVHMSDMMSVLNYDRIKAEFRNFQEYQEFVSEVRKQFRGENGFMSLESFRALAALAYTTVTGLSGSSPQIGSLIQGIK